MGENGVLMRKEKREKRRCEN